MTSRKTSFTHEHTAWKKGKEKERTSLVTCVCTWQLTTPHTSTMIHNPGKRIILNGVWLRKVISLITQTFLRTLKKLPMTKAIQNWAKLRLSSNDNTGWHCRFDAGTLQTTKIRSVWANHFFWQLRKGVALTGVNVAFLLAERLTEPRVGAPCHVTGWKATCGRWAWHTRPCCRPYQPNSWFRWLWTYLRAQSDGQLDLRPAWGSATTSLSCR